MIITTRMDAESARVIFSSVPTCFRSSGVYCAGAVFAAAGDDFTDGVCALTAAIGQTPAAGAAAAGCVCPVLFCLLEAYLICLRFDLPGILALFSQLFSSWMSFFITTTDMFCCEMSIYLCCRDIRMSKQFLYRSQISPAAQHMSRKAVSQSMGRHVHCQACLFSILFKYLPKTLSCQPFTATV